MPWSRARLRSVQTCWVNKPPDSGCYRAQWLQVGRQESIDVLENEVQHYEEWNKANDCSNNAVAVFLGYLPSAHHDEKFT